MPINIIIEKKYIHTYIHTYHIISFRRSTKSVVQTVGHETCQKKTTQTKKQKHKTKAQYNTVNFRQTWAGNGTSVFSETREFVRFKISAMVKLWTVVF
jgi:hypothetical protein